MDKETQNNMLNNYKALEDDFPLLDRRHKGWKLVGFDEKAKPRPTIQNPYGKVPIWRYYGWNLHNKYTGQVQRMLRAEKGVGSVRKIKKQTTKDSV